MSIVNRNMINKPFRGLWASDIKADQPWEKWCIDNDFRIDRVYAYDRPTVLKDEEQGLANWMKQFFASELGQMSKENQEQILKMVEDVTREKLWNGKEWVADYRRLRAIAYKR